MSAYLPFPADGHEVRWATWQGEGDETTTLVWENEGWTITGTVSRERVQYVMRVSPLWHVRQFLLFRDLEEPDMWLGTDGAGRWGEMNGAHRPDIDGCTDLSLSITPLTTTLPIRRLPLHVGDSAELAVACVDVETLAITRETHRYTRLTESGWCIEHSRDGVPHHDVEVEVDQHGLVVDYPERFRRA